MKRVVILTAVIAAISSSVSAQTFDAYLTQRNKHIRADFRAALAARPDYYSPKSALEKLAVQP